MSLIFQFRPESIGRSSIHQVRTDVDEITMIPQNTFHPVVSWPLKGLASAYGGALAQLFPYLHFDIAMMGDGQ